MPGSSISNGNPLPGMKKMKSFVFSVFEKIVELLARTGINKKTPGASAVYNYLFRGLWPYPEFIEVQGSRMYLNPKEKCLDMKKTFKDYADNLIHEEATTALFKKNVREGNVVVDLGANIGYFTLLASRIVGPKGKVFAFEPEPRNYSYLKKNIEINSYKQAAAFRKAVSSQNGKTELFICDYDSGHHTINQFSGIETYGRGRDSRKTAIEIETVALDDFLREKAGHVDVIKMDVEGAEFLALSGMDKILRNNKGLKMFVEFFPLLIEKMGNSPREFIERLLGDYNFSVFVIPDDYDASKHEMVKINSAEEAMAFIKKEEDHINLFLEKKPK